MRTWYSSLTLLSIELQVHALGGGVLVFVPREADRVRLAKPEHVAHSSTDDIHKALQSNDPDAPYAVSDAALIAAGVLTQRQIEAVKSATEILRSWRRRPR